MTTHPTPDTDALAVAVNAIEIARAWPEYVREGYPTLTQDYDRIAAAALAMHRIERTDPSYWDNAETHTRKRWDEVCARIANELAWLRDPEVVVREAMPDPSDWR